MPLPKSICDINHPPKTSPMGFVSAGMAMVRITNSPLGFSGDRILSDHLITGHRKRSRGIPMSYLLGFAGGSFDYARMRQLQNQHAIAVAKETIPLSHRFLVGAQDKFAIGKGAYQHEQGRTRQMKICQQNINPPKLERRIDKSIRLAFAGLNFPQTALNRFQDSYRCCSDRDDALCIRDCLGCIRRNRKSPRLPLM